MEVLVKGEVVDSIECYVMLCVMLVVGWNLEEEFIEENVKILFCEVFQFWDMIDCYVLCDVCFFRKLFIDFMSGWKKKQWI